MKRFVKTLEPLSGLPNGFTEVEYLESTTGQYIDTGVGVKSNTVVKAVFSITSGVQGKSYFGARNSTNERFQIVNSFGVGSGYFYNTNVYPIVNKQFEIEMRASGEVYLDGIKRDATNGTFSAVAFDRTLYIFHTNYYDGSGTPTSSKFWKVQILEGDTLVRDYIPALDSNNRPCMYDRVEGKPYYNIATTDDDFSYGKKIIPVEYLESTGEQYIDTGITSNLNTVAEMNFKVVSYSTNNTVTLFGGISSNIGISTNISKTNTDRYSRFGAKYTVIKNLDIEGIKSTIKIDKNAFVINGQSYSVGETDSFNGPNMYLFKADGIASTYNTTTDVYSCKLWDNGTLVRDYIPVIDEDNTAYMFDRISHTLYANAGSGTFSYGDKVYKQRVRLIEERAELNGLPNGLKEVEYLKCNGAQYIDTGYSFNSNTDEITIVYQNESTAQHKWLFGSYETGKNIGISSGTLTAPTIWYNGSVSLTQDDEYYKGHILKYDSTGMSNDYVNKSAFKDIQGTWNIYLFALNNTGTSVNSYFGYGRIYMYQHKRNGVLIRDFIPCLDANNKPGLFDRVSQKIFYNQGTGADFTYGKQIIPVEYIESTGTQYIDTGYKTKANSTVDICMAGSEFQSGKYLFGSVGSSEDSLIRCLLYNTTSYGDIFSLQVGVYGVQADGYISYDTNYHRYLITPTEGYIDNVHYSHTRTDNEDRSFYIFSFNTSGTLNYSKAKFKYCKIYEGDTLVRDLIPVIDENNVGYLYDKTSHIMYENKGTGDFLYGEKLYTRRMRFNVDPWFVKEYELATYIQSTGNAYIDTGYNIVTSTDEVEMDYELLSDTVYKWIFGEHDDGARFGIGSGDGEAKRNVAYGSTTTKAADKYFFNGKHHYAANTSGVYLDGTKIVNYSSFSSTSTLYLFNLNLSGNDYCTSTRIWKYAHKRNGQYIRYYLPAKRKSDNKYGMLDMVSRQFYPSIGSEDFTGE